jgi:general secretion pathway protein E
VLSTLHVASVFGVLSRLVPFGLDPQVIAENLSAVINQRLVRRNCPHCSVPMPLSQAQRDWLGEYASDQVKHGQGCERCAHTGYYGRLPIYEIFNIDDAMANLLAEGHGRMVIREAAMKAGFRPILEMAKWRIGQGQTTFEEVTRAVGETMESNSP